MKREILELTTNCKEATQETIKVNSTIYSVLDVEDTTEAELAVRGLIDAPKVLADFVYSFLE